MAEESPIPILSEEAERIIQSYYEYWKTLSQKSNQTVSVGQVLSRVAFLYERIRNAVDYKGDHLLRRNAIERIIRRQLWERPKTSSQTVSESLTKELIWARYFRNHEIATNKLKMMSVALEKYFYLLEYIAVHFRGNKKEEYYWRDFILSIASSEVEEILDPSLFYIDTFSDAMYSWFKKNFYWEDGDISDDDKDMQIFIAVHKSLPKSDEARLRYHLVKKVFPNWSSLSDAQVSSMAEDLFSVFEIVNSKIRSAVQGKLYRFVQRRTAPFQIFREVLEENIDDLESLVADKENFESEVRRVAERRYEDIGKKVRRGIIRSIIYIFITKILVVLLIEVPYELYVIGEINYIPMAINVLLPAVLMFLVGLTIKKPGEENTERIIDKLNSFVYRGRSGEKAGFSLAAKKSTSMVYKLFVAFYVFFFIATFGAIAYLLLSIGFNILSAAIFFMFLSLVLLFSYRVRFSASELKVTEKREGFMGHILTNLTLPFLNLGVWLSQGLSKLNFLIVLMDFMIEAPLKTLINVVEDWGSFIREKKDEVVEVPMQ